ncbi:MAG: hypothetical protein HQK50_09415 [Oligoflexia bacterium]|nr:hypothetical protein [Oligoflexia bacterium]
MDCVHKNFSIKKIEKETLGQKFIYKTKVCSDCGAYLRGVEFERAYRVWLEKFYEERRDKFQVQCNLSGNLLLCLDKLLEDYPGINQTSLMRALVAVYLGYIDTNTVLAQELSFLIDEAVFASFSKSPKKRVNIQFKPKMMIEMLAIAEFTSEKVSKIIESSIETMMSLFASKDQKLKNFWENNIKKQLDIVLKAA